MTSLRSSPHESAKVCPGCTRLRVALLTCLHELGPAAVRSELLESKAHLRRGELARHYGSVGRCAQALFVERGGHYTTLFATSLGADGDVGAAAVAGAAGALVDRLGRDVASARIFFGFARFPDAPVISEERRMLRERLVAAAMAAEAPGARNLAPQSCHLLFAAICEDMQATGGERLGDDAREKVAALCHRFLLAGGRVT